MKNKEEPSIDLTRGNPSTPADRHIPGCQSVETTGSTVRPDDAAAASIEKPALSLFSGPLTVPVVDQSKIEHRLFRFDHAEKRNFFVEPPDADPHVRWCGEGGQQWPPLPDFAALTCAKARSTPMGYS
jgi:hypothetical protein